MEFIEKELMSYRGEYKKGRFGKKNNMYLILYKSEISVCAFDLYSEGLSQDTREHTIQLGNVVKSYTKEFNGDLGLCIECKKDSVVTTSNSIIVIMGVENMEEFIAFITTSKKELLDSIIQQKKDNQERKLLIEKEKIQNQQDIDNFYKECFAFHIKNETPTYNLFKEKNRIILIYIDKDKNLNFLKIDGYNKEENNNVIMYKDIHYYEIAGNKQYVTDINGNYAGTGASMTGSSISKLATAGGGLLFGIFGLMMGAALTYKPANIKGESTTFQINSETIQIDDRSVVLNFYSELKKEYRDIELPHEMYNFLQTYLPEKKYDIVNELEKKTIIHHSLDLIESGAAIRNASNLLTEKPIEDDPSAFKLKVQKIQMMKEAGLLTDEEFLYQKNKLLESFL